MIITDCNLNKIMQSGQCFRINKIDGNRYLILSRDKASIGKQMGQDTELYCYEEDEDYWEKYFNTEIDLKRINKDIIGKNEYIDKAIKFSEGLRLLNQDEYECLISFIISQRKNINAIRKSIVQLCVNYGVEKEFMGIKYNTFPTVYELYNKQLNGKCGLGYRAEYIEILVNKLYNREIELYKLRGRKDPLKELKQIKGVGDKVANCVMLYSMGFINAFPIDVWIQRIIEKEFNGAFPMNSYPKYKGLIQLYMFYYERFKI